MNGLSWNTGRKLASVLLCMAASVGLLSGAATMSGLLSSDQLAREREFSRNFRQTEAYVAAYQARQSRLPSESELQTWAAAKGVGLFTTNLTLNGCMNENFEKEKNDRFVISFWRGEWDDCYASPSGRTTLLTLRDWGLYLAAHLSVSVVLGFLAWLIFPRSKGSKSINYAASNS